MKKNRMLNLVVIVALIITIAFIGGCAPAGEAEGGSGFGTLLIFMVLIFGVFYFLSIRPQRKRQKQHQDLVSELHRGDKVITTGGIYGQIEGVSEDNVILKVESGATMRVLKDSIISKRER